jgi:hypothetical protein
MQFEICFLDRKGQLSCLLVSSFDDHRHASVYARHVMDTAACRDILMRAEVLGDGHPIALIVHPSVGNPQPPALRRPMMNQAVPAPTPLRVLRH